MPAILTGNIPQNDPLPIFPNYRANLFTLLGTHYDMWVHEDSTQLCPRALCPLMDHRILKDNVLHWSGDLSILLLHRALPKAIRHVLPDIGHTSGGFLSRFHHDKTTTQQEMILRDFRLWNTRWDRLKRLHQYVDYFDDFFSSIRKSNKPPLIYYLSSLPHVPWEYLPSGKRYSAKHFASIIPGLSKNEAWGSDAFLVKQGYQRHLLQVGYVDKIVGSFLDQLKDIGIYDETLIIITSDHGASFRANDFRRPVSKTNFSEIMSIPLFIKRPQQKQSHISYKPAASIDIVPTIFSVLNFNSPVQTMGHSLFDPTFFGHPKQLILSKSNEDWLSNKQPILHEFTSAELVHGMSTAVEQKHRQFGPSNDPLSLFRIGPYPHLLGKKISTFVVNDFHRAQIQFTPDEALNNLNLKDKTLPVVIAGHLKSLEKESLHIDLVITVNGTIGATAPIEIQKNTGKQFALLIPEILLQNGMNDIDFFVIQGEKSQPPILKRLRRDKGVFVQ